MFGMLAVLTAFIALFLKDYIPEDTSRKIGADSVDSILRIIANSMLAVTTFSLSTMVAAYTAATSNVTPRATQLLLADNTSQNALSVFIGSFIFSVVSIVALSIGIYGDSGRLVLFVVTVLVLIIIIGVMIRWVNYLSGLGRVSQTIHMVEKEAARAIHYRIEQPYLGGNPLLEAVPKSSRHAVICAKIGFVQHIDMVALDRIAEAQKATIYVQCLPGIFNDSIRPLAYVSKKMDETIADSIRDAFYIGDERSFEQDPRFGLIVLSEIASRALSPGVNDPGTAIDVIGTGLRVLMPWVSAPEKEKEVLYPHVYVPPITVGDLFDDLFTPIARDGAGIVEVGVRLQKTFASLHAAGNASTKKEAKAHSQLALKRARKALALKEDIHTVATLAL